MGKRSRLLLVGIMWAAALVVVGVLVLRQPSPEDEGPAPEQVDDDVPVFEPGDRAPRAKRASLPVAPPEKGPPRTFRADRRHTARSPHAGPAVARVAWTFETGGRVTAQPVVDRRGRIYVGSHDGFFYCLDSVGTVRWAVELHGDVYSTAFVDDDGNAYVGSDADAFYKIGPDGRIRFRLSTDGCGARPGECDADTGAVMSPSGLIHFAAGPELWAIRQDGTVEWKFRARSKIYSTPAVDDDGTVYVGSQDDHLYALAPDGRVRWSYRTRGDNDSSPVLGDDGTIYFGSDDRRVYALDRDGRLKWSTDLEGYVRAPVALAHDGHVIAGVFGPRPRVVALEPVNGEVVWFFPVSVADSTETGIMSGPIVDRDGNIFVGANDDYVYALAPTGELRWAFGTGGDVDSSPILGTNGVLYVGSDDKMIYAIGGSTSSSR